MTATTVELASFTLAEGVTETDLLAASDRVERDFLAQSSGYLGRVLVRKDARSWADIVFWRSSQDVEQAMAGMMTSEACGAYMQCMLPMEGDSGLTIFNVVKYYGSIPSH